MTSLENHCYQLLYKNFEKQKLLVVSVYSRELHEIFKTRFFFRTPQVACFRKVKCLNKNEKYVIGIVIFADFVDVLRKYNEIDVSAEKFHIRALLVLPSRCRCSFEYTEAAMRRQLVKRLLCKGPQILRKILAVESFFSKD